MELKVDSLAQNRDLLVKTIDQGYFETADGSKVPTQGNLDLLGIAIEAGISERSYKQYNSSVWKKGDTDIYGGFHNNGHMLLALITDGKYYYDAISNTINVFLIISNIIISNFPDPNGKL